MCKRLRIWPFVPLGSLLTSTSLLAEGVITMTTSKAVGETISLAIEANGNVTIDGALEAGEANACGFKPFRLKSQTITIRGNVTLLVCADNQLTSLNVSGCSTLTRLDCSYNQLTSLNVSGCTALELLYCNDNKLTNLDMSRNTALKTLGCNDNKLTNLNISGCARLMVIDCFSNYINGKAMTKLVNSLPNRRRKSRGAIYLVDRSSKKRDENSCSTADVTTAKKKNWEVKKNDPSGWVSYSGD